MGSAAPIPPEKAPEVKKIAAIVPPPEPPKEYPKMTAKEMWTKVCEVNILQGWVDGCLGKRGGKKEDINLTTVTTTRSKKGASWLH